MLEGILDLKLVETLWVVQMILWVFMIPSAVILAFLPLYLCPCLPWWAVGIVILIIGVACLFSAAVWAAVACGIWRLAKHTAKGIRGATQQSA